jgi:hypothetical protein
MCCFDLAWPLLGATAKQETEKRFFCMRASKNRCRQRPEMVIRVTFNPRVDNQIAAKIDFLPRARQRAAMLRPL